MKHCEHCQVEFSGFLERCPLCQAQLSGTPSPSPFPVNKVRKSGAVALAVLGFTSGACVLVMLFLGYVLPLDISIVITVCLALAVNYFYVRNVILHRPDFLRVVMRYFLVLLLFAAIWFFLTGDKMVTTFIVPGICLVALVFDAVLMAVFRGTFVSGYAKYLLYDIALGLVPLALVLLDWTTWDVPAAASALAAAVVTLALLAFARKRLVAELRKLFSA